MLELSSTFADVPAFAGLLPLVVALVATAKTKSETLRTDADVFDTWTSFVVAGEHLAAFTRALTAPPGSDPELVRGGVELVERARVLVGDMARARVPMPKSTHALYDQLATYRERVRVTGLRRNGAGAESGSPRPSAPPAPARG
jgi:hypothetical protein